MRPCGEAKRKSIISYRYVPKTSRAHWSSGCEAGKGSLLRKVGAKELKHCMELGVVERRYQKNMKFSRRYLLFSFKYNMASYLVLSLKICIFSEKKTETC